MTTKAYIGIADAHGIESIVPEEGADTHRALILSLRANANRQRHAVSFRAMLDDGAIALIEALLKAQKFVDALTALKLQAKEVKVESPQHERSWHMIPNPKLDPFA